MPQQSTRIRDDKPCPCLKPSVLQLHSDISLCTCACAALQMPPWVQPVLPAAFCFTGSLGHLTVLTVCVRVPSISQAHSDISAARVCVRVQHCSCPPGFNMSCPDNGTAPGCIILPDIPSGSRTFRATGIVVALLVVVLGWAFCTTRLMADLCRMCLGAGNPLGE